jgi:hypothetical protein
MTRLSVSVTMVVTAIACGSSETKPQSGPVGSFDAAGSDGATAQTGGMGAASAFDGSSGTLAAGGSAGSATVGMGAGGTIGSAGGSGQAGAAGAGFDSGSDRDSMLERDSSAGRDSGFDPDSSSNQDSGTSRDSGLDSGSNCTSVVSQPPIGACGILGTVTLEHRTGEASERLSFDVRLQNNTAGWVMPVSVPVNQIEVHYYLSQEENSGWQASVESFVQRGPDVDLRSTSEISVAQLTPTLGTHLGYQTHLIRIRNSSAAVLVPASSAGDPRLEFRVMLSPINSAPPNQNHANDISYKPAASAFLGNLGMAVFVCGQLVAGCTPGDSGVGPLR